MDFALQRILFIFPDSAMPPPTPLPPPSPQSGATPWRSSKTRRRAPTPPPPPASPSSTSSTGASPPLPSASMLPDSQVRISPLRSLCFVTMTHPRPGFSRHQKHHSENTRRRVLFFISEDLFWVSQLRFCARRLCPPLSPFPPHFENQDSSQFTHRNFYPLIFLIGENHWRQWISRD